MTVVGLTAAEAQSYKIIAMSIFLWNHFICTFIFSYIKLGKMLMLLACGAITFTLDTILLDGIIGPYSLIGISVCMFIIFPTIYAIALEGMGDDASLVSTGQVIVIFVYWVSSIHQPLRNNW
jgi:FHS family L-fucose permease-like MFS transporter